MATRKIDEMVWLALTEQEFRNGMLNGRRQELATSVGLSPVEKETIMTVRAETLEAFAAALC